MIQLIPHANLHPSPLNPRQRFDDAELRDLAASIAAQGVLQNLVARPYAAQPDHFEIIAGVRRWRACALLIAEGKMAPDAPLPVAVREATDLDLLQLATAENCARNALAPMEEAEAFAALVKAGQATADIARLIGRTQRFVQLRLALVERLGPAAQKALRAGRISVEQARALTMGDKKRQAEVLPRLLEAPTAHWHSAEAIKRDVSRKLVPVTRAAFDPALYNGAIVEDPDDESIRYFADVGQFERLQKEAIAARKAALAARYPFVEIVKSYSPQLPYGWSKTPKDPKAGALILTHERGVTVHEGVRRADDLAAETRRAGGGKKDGPPKPELTLGFLTHCRHRKTHALQAAIAADPDAALRVACLALMSPKRGVARLEVTPLEGEDRALVPAPAAAERAKPWRQRFARWIDKPAAADDDDRRLGPHVPARAIALRPAQWIADPADDGADIAERADLAAMEALDRLDRRQLLDLHAVLIAGICGSFSGHRPALGDDPQPRAVATSLGLSAAVGIDEAFLAACGKPQLIWIAHDLARDHDGPPLAARTAARLRQDILAAGDKLTAYAPPWLRFDTAAAIKDRLERGAPRAKTATNAKKARRAKTPLPSRYGQAPRGGAGRGKPKAPKPKKIARGALARKKAA